jgi:predicted dehydrogenase
MGALRIGIVGTGGMGKIHASAYMKNPDCIVNGVCSITRDLAQDFADGRWESVAYSEGEMKPRSLYRIERIYDDYRQMAEDDDIDAVSIVTPNALHYEVAMEMIRHKKHVLVEKPLAVNSKLAAEMVDAARNNGVILATGHMWRFHKEAQYIRKVVSEGLLGDIVQTKSYGLHMRWNPGGWFANKELAGGGALIDMGVHAIDTARYILGEPVVASVYASVGARFAKREVDDYAQIMVKHKDGCVSLFESGWDFPFISGQEASTEIYGTKGYARLFPTFVCLRIGGEWGKFVPEAGEEHTSTAPYERQVNNFVDAILGRAACLTEDRVGLEVMRIVDAAYESSERDDVVKFGV